MKVILDTLKRSLPAVLTVALAGCGSSGEKPPVTTPAPTEEVEDFPRFGEARCERYAQVNLFGQYMVQNNVWNDAASGQTQCVTPLWDGEGPVAGFIVEPHDISTGSVPASFPGIVYGWHYGTYFGAYNAPLRVEEVTRVPSSWRFSVPDDVRYDAAYDLWLHPEPNPPTLEGTVEIMIWVAERDVTPIGEKIDQIELEGATWEVWFGPNSGFSTVTYRRTEGVSDFSLELTGFVADAVTRSDLEPNWYLLSVEAGFELWQASEPLTTHRYEVRIE